VCVPLSRLGVWTDFRVENHEICLGSCSSWGSHALGYNDFLFNSLGSGWHLDRRRFDAFLARTASERGATILTGACFEGYERTTKGRLRLRLVGTNREATSVVARFVVDATGLRSCFAKRLGARKRFVDRLVCAVAFFECTSTTSFPGMTMLEAVEYGWWYAAKLPDRRVTVALASDPDILRRSALRKHKEWLDHLADAKHISTALSGSHFVEDSLVICPAPSFLLDYVAGDDWLAVGDAAAAYDPISSRGIHKRHCRMAFMPQRPYLLIWAVTALASANTNLRSRRSFGVTWKVVDTSTT
jgi:flavin-dependent dehydrogenase